MNCPNGITHPESSTMTIQVAVRPDMVDIDQEGVSYKYPWGCRVVSTQVSRANFPYPSYVETQGFGQTPSEAILQAVTAATDFFYTPSLA